MSNLRRTSIIVLSLAAICTGCLPKNQSTAKLASDSEPTVCDLNAIEFAIETTGILYAMQSDAAACLDGYLESGESKAAADSNQKNTEQAHQEQISLSLTEQKHVDLVAVIGREVLHDLLEQVSQSSVNGSNLAGNVDITKLMTQVQHVQSITSGVLARNALNIRFSLYYSFPDLFSAIKTYYVDPLVNGYDGIGHRMIQRRYAKGKGIVYRIVARKLTEALNQLDAQARSEFSRYSTPTFQPSLIRKETSISMKTYSFLSLWYDGKSVVNVPYDRVQEIASRLESI